MKVLGIVGPADSGKTRLTERLARALDGRVATVKHLTHAPDIDTTGKDTARHRAAGAETTYGLTDEGGWFATGETRTLDGTLAALAPDYEYALVEGYSDAQLPQVELGGRTGDGETLLEAADAAAVDIGELKTHIEATEPFETLGSLVARVKASSDGDRAGAIATFTGRVRAKDDPGDTLTERLDFEKYDAVANERLRTIRRDLESRDGVFEVRLHHRTGAIEAGEDIVFVVVLAGHRAEAFTAVEDGIDRLKDEVPIFKKEVTVTDDYWVDADG
ncbi:molybdopterin synthase [Halosegnis longus]|uniref:molybdopterin synthase n=1 Tax=Halosegnis longus TaxID=2216012 RepID=UPI00096A3F08|nr:molybdopterin synthase [Salella cibi]